MIARLIEWCIYNRAMVLVLTAALVVAGAWSATRIKVDAIPDLSDVQVIIRTEYEGQAPQIVEDQVTYPLTTAMLSVPNANVVRGKSMFGMSFVYIIFDDGTDIYWARSRVLEQLSVVRERLPEGVSPQLGPDATGVGWILEYVLTTGPYCPQHPNGLWHDPRHDAWYASPAEAAQDEATQRALVHHRVFHGRETCPLTGEALTLSDTDLAELRSLQDWFLRYELTAVPGVSEVASVGGFEKQYQIVVDPVKLQAFGVSIGEVMTAVRRANSDAGGRLIELSEHEYMVRGLGYLGRLTEDELREASARGETPERARTRRVIEDLRHVALSASADGTPLYLASVADVRVGPEQRRGVIDWNGEGQTAGGIIVMRFGENARTTITAVKARLAELSHALPPGVAVEIAYDRSDLIDRAVNTLSHALVMEISVVALVCILFLLHARSELVAVFVLPTGVLTALLAMHLLGINANIMSLGGIAIAIGVMVDSSIVMVENAHKHLDREEDRVRRLEVQGLHAEPRPRTQIILEAAREVGPTLFFSLLIITVSFLPVFVLGEQSGRLFRPLAYTKTFAMAAAAFLAVTAIPVLMTYFITPRVLPRAWGRVRNTLITLAVVLVPAALLLVIPLGTFEPYRYWLAGGWAIVAAMVLVPQKIIHEDANPISWGLRALYNPLFVFALRYRWLTVIGTAALVASTIIPLQHFGSEFMPPLEEGDLLYMPTTDPGISVTKSSELLQQTDRIIKRFPEVESVRGKIGWAETATDPAPISMFETTIVLKRDKTRWRHVGVPRFFDHWPRWVQRPLARIWPTSRPITLNELIYGYHLPDAEQSAVPGMNAALQIPGLTNAWTMPIRTRIDMLSTGIKTPVGVKVLGPELAVVGEIAARVKDLIQADERTGPFTTSAFAEPTIGGNYVDIRIDRVAIARYGLSIEDVQEVIRTAMGGMRATATVEGLERYSVNIRYPDEMRDSPARLRQVLVPIGGMADAAVSEEHPGAAPATRGGAGHVPLGQLAAIEIRRGPDEIKSENARRSTSVYIDIAGIDVGTYVADAQRVVAASVALPQGYSIVWSGQYEYMLAARQRLMVAIPLTIVVIVLLLYLSTGSWMRVAIVALTLPTSLVGALWLPYLLDYNLSLAVWVGIIALAGLDAETGLIMLLYLDNSFDRFKAEGRMRDTNDLWHAIHDGAVMRIRPKTMTVVTTFIGLFPLLFAEGAGADTMRRLAAPMIGGLGFSFLLELLLYPAIYYIIKKHSVAAAQIRSPEAAVAA